MQDGRLIWRFSLAALAVWRVTYLLSEEDGPWDGMARLRARLGGGFFGRVMHCFFCVSLWVSLPLAVWLSDGWVGLLIHWQALSGAACLFQRVTGVPDRAFSGIEASFEGEESCSSMQGAAANGEAH